VGTAAEVTIEWMVKEDLEQVMAIEERSFSTPWTRNLFLAEFRNRPISLMLVARSGGTGREVLGYIVCWSFVDEIHVLDLAAKDSVRRQGIGRRLVIAALGIAYQYGARKAFLEVRRSNAAALALYEGLGFRMTQVRSEYYESPVEDAIVMTLDTEIFRRLLGISPR
jgi:ribosomal-protein-alanine N-acetyltransferase